ncbi:DUF3987 domain-containing protein [Candidatus Acetothermia bacterium]|jgi:thiamine pyrophosphokinase|nr:DUF3987 domain-containing protein [Candidatus Acetothermia bacterium]MCI2432223.1 DUF3987 domain-containing protein [Candidatus Acetothermia bacterium]MCI2436126.1 DUF3987 domain-containing protein [Candidatus Acetothermia bacterium]
MNEPHFDYSGSSHHSSSPSDLGDFKALPRALEAERAVLGAALLSPGEVVPVLGESLTASDFWERRHQRFLEAILALYEQNAPIRPTEVVDWLEKNDKSRDIGELPVSYLNDLLAQAPLVASVPYYCDKIKEAARKREVAARLLAAYEKAKTDPDAALEEIVAQAKVDKIGETAHNGAAPAPLGFPESAYIGLASDFADTYSTACESPKSYFYLSFLTCLGALVGDRVILQGATKAPARLYIVLLGASGLSRKSTAIKLTTDFFARNVMSFPVVRGLGSAEGLAKTIEKRNYTNCLMVFDELRTFVDKAKIEGSILLSIVNTLFDETRAENHTKGHDIELQDVHLSLLSACTLDTFSNLFDANFVAIGFPNRLLLVLDEAKESIPVPREVPSSIEQALTQELGATLYQLRAYTPANPLTMRLTPEAEAIWGEFYRTIPRTVTGTRIDAIGLRLAMLIALSAGKTEIDAETINAATGIAKWQLAVREEVMPTDAANAIAVMEQKIVKVLRSRGPLAEKKLRDQTNAYRAGLWVFSTALANLQQAKEVLYEPRSRVYAVLD